LRLKKQKQQLQGRGDELKHSEFWANFYHWKSYSGGAGVTGWINVFFPFSSSLQQLNLDAMHGKNTFGGSRNTSSFPSGHNSFYFVHNSVTIHFARLFDELRLIP